MSFQSLEAVTSRLMNDLIAVYDDTRLNRKIVRDKVLVARANVLSKYLRQNLGSIAGQYYNQCCFEVNCEPVCPGAPVTVIVPKRIRGSVAPHRGCNPDCAASLPEDAWRGHQRRNQQDHER